LSLNFNHLFFFTDLFGTSSENAAIPVPTLEFAALALRNAEYLLSRLTVPNDAEGKSGPPVLRLFRNYILTPAAGISEKTEMDSKAKPDLRVKLSEVNTLSWIRKPEYYSYMKNVIIADSSYVALCLGDYLTSLHKAEQLLMQQHLSSNHK